MTRRAQLVAHTSTACASVITSATRAFYFYYGFTEEFRFIFGYTLASMKAQDLLIFRTG